jgi:hypothetical protein
VSREPGAVQIVSAKHAARNCDLLHRFVRASMAGMCRALADRKAAVASVLRRHQTPHALTDPRAASSSSKARS